MATEQDIEALRAELENVVKANMTQAEKVKKLKAAKGSQTEVLSLRIIQ